MGEIAALAKRWELEQKRQDHRFGMLCTILAEIHRNKDVRRKPFEPGDFFPSVQHIPTEEEKAVALVRGLGFTGQRKLRETK